MQITAVESTTLSTVAYDGIRNLLQLEFRNRAIYHDFGVPAAVYESLLAAPSKGAYFSRAIRGRYAYVCIAGVPTAVPGRKVPPHREHSGEAPWHAR